MLNKISSIIIFGQWHSVTFFLFYLVVCFVPLKKLAFVI